MRLHVSRCDHGLSLDAFKRKRTHTADRRTWLVPRPAIWTSDHDEFDESRRTLYVKAIFEGNKNAFELSRRFIGTVDDGGCFDVAQPYSGRLELNFWESDSR